MMVGAGVRKVFQSLVLGVVASLVMVTAAWPQDAGDVAMNGNGEAMARAHVIGLEDAPVTITIFQSFTNPLNALFYTRIFPVLEKKYIRSGKLKLVFKDFPFSSLAAKAALAGQCFTNDRFFDFAAIAFKQQKNWMESSNPQESLRKIAVLAGVPGEDFDKCLANQEVLFAILDEKIRIMETYDVSSPPVFLVNDTIARGEMTLKMFQKRIRAAIKGQ
jgi:protein-disulfide isomerase